MRRPYIFKYGYPSRIYPEPNYGRWWFRVGPYMIGWLPKELL